MPRPKYTYYEDAVEAGYFRNRMTLKRKQDAGTFPPSVDMGANQIAFLDTDLDEVDRRILEGIADQPNPEWLRRHLERKARKAARQPAAA